MRLRQWLTPTLAFIRSNAAVYRVNPRAIVFGAACCLLFSGVRDFSPAAAKIVLGAVFLTAVLWPESRKRGTP